MMSVGVRSTAILYLVTLLLALPTSLYSQESAAGTSSFPIRLTLGLAEEIVLMRNPSLLRERQKVVTARAGVTQARLRPNPDFELISESYPLFEPKPGPFFQRQELIALFGQNVETAGKRQKRTQVAEQGVTVAQSSLQDILRRLRLELRQRYYAVVLAKANLELSREILAQFDEIIRVNEARYRQGEISGLDLSRVQTERRRFFGDFVEAELQLRNAKIALLELLGITDMAVEFDVVERLAFNAFGAELPELQEGALAARPDIVAQRGQVERGRRQLTFEKALRTPDITPLFGYKRNERDNTVVFGVSMSLPLFNRNQGGIARASAEIEEQKYALQRVELVVRREVYQAYFTVIAREQEVRALEATYVPSARRAREVAQVSYRLGALDLIGFLDAERAFRETLRAYYQALHDHQVAVFALNAAVGREP